LLTADKGWYSRMVGGRGANNSPQKYCENIILNTLLMFEERFIFSEFPEKILRGHQREFGFYSQWKFITLRVQYTTLDYRSQLF
jgi:hypothetical protein